MTGLSQAELIAAAELYVLQVMLYPGAPSRRVLGVQPEADRAATRANLRLLLNWLHPDKNPSEWHAPFASRVIAAWRQIDGGLEDEQLRGRNVDRPRSWFAYRMPWIAWPSEATRKRSPRWSIKGLRIFLGAVTLICGRPRHLMMHLWDRPGAVVDGMRQRPERASRITQAQLSFPSFQFIPFSSFTCISLLLTSL